MRPSQQPMQYCSSFEGDICLWSSCSSVTLLDQQSLSQAWIECGNKTLLALLPTNSIDKAFLVIGRPMQFSIGKMIKRRNNSITLCPIDRADYHFRNRWALLRNFEIVVFIIKSPHLAYWIDNR